MSSVELSDFSPVAPKAARGPSRLGGIIAGIAWEFFLVILIFGVPRFERVFQDFGVPLPWATVAAIRSSHLVIARAPLLLVLVCAAGIVRFSLMGRGESEAPRPWSVVMLAFPFLLIALTLIALGLPLMSITQRLSR